MEAGLMKERDLFTLFALVNRRPSMDWACLDDSAGVFEGLKSQDGVHKHRYIAETLEGGRSGQTVQSKRTEDLRAMRSTRVIGVGPE